MFNRNNSILVQTSVTRKPLLGNPQLHDISIDTDGIYDNIISAYFAGETDKFDAT